FFFFSSIRRHTSFSRDWSSDVCSSDLNHRFGQDLPDLLPNTIPLRHGRNEVVTKGVSVWQQIRQVLTEPMVILLFIAALLYLISGETGDAVFMALAILFVTGISWYQEARSRKALSALKSITAATSKVIRNGEVSEIPREELVIGDYMVLTEGMLVPRSEEH